MGVEECRCGGWEGNGGWEVKLIVWSVVGKNGIVWVMIVGRKWGKVNGCGRGRGKGER